jgi:hypothetical protein
MHIFTENEINFNAIKFLINIWKNSSKTPFLFSDFLLTTEGRTKGDSEHFGFRVLLLFRDKICFFGGDLPAVKELPLLMARTGFRHPKLSSDVVYGLLIHGVCIFL